MNRRTFLATGFAAGATVPLAQAAPLPNRPAAPRGIVLFTADRQILFVDEFGKTLKKFDALTLVEEGWQPIAVSPSGTRAAFLEDPPGRNFTEHQRLRIASLVHEFQPWETKATPANNFFVWSRDGKSLIGDRWVLPVQFLGPSYLHNIQIDLGTGNWSDLQLPAIAPNQIPKPFTEHRVYDCSPDGQWLLTTSLEEGKFARIHLVGRDGKTRRPLTDPQPEVGRAQFSPDGKTVLFSRITMSKAVLPCQRWLEARRSRYQLDLFSLKIAGGAPTGIASIVMHSDHDQYVQFAWRPDGKRIVLLYQQPWGPPGEELLDRPRLITCNPDGSDRKSNRINNEYLEGFITLHGWR